jgi:hypothetical protein
MGDLGTSGDAPFGGEVALDADSQVGAGGVEWGGKEAKPASNADRLGEQTE